MHIQARAQPQRSPADVVEFLKVLAGDGTDDDPINIEGVTGSGIEHGGHLVFAVTHGRENEAHDRLGRVGYRCQWTNDVYAEKIPPDPSDQASDLVANDEPDPNQPGVLLGILERARDSGLAAGRPIHEILIGAFTDEPGRFFAQVTFVGAHWRDDVPPDDD
jgi:hypothetical protein